MKMTQAALAALISLAAVGAHATSSLSFAEGAQAATDFDFAANVSGSGSKVFTASSGIAAEPTGTNSDGFLAIQPGQSAVVTLGGVASVSFEWGTPDASWNTLLVNLSNGSSETFRSGDLGISTDSYVEFTGIGGATIESLTFEENTNPAFEVSNFKVTAVPEPTNVALLLAGLGLMGVVARRRRL